MGLPRPRRLRTYPAAVKARSSSWPGASTRSGRIALSAFLAACLAGVLGLAGLGTAVGQEDPGQEDAARLDWRLTMLRVDDELVEVSAAAPPASLDSGALR